MITNNIFNETAIFLQQQFNSKEEVFQKMASYFVDNGFGKDKQSLVEAFYQREKESSTAFIDGIGIPHAKTSAIVKPGICVITTKNGINWDSIDDQPTFFFIGLAIPENNAETIHLKMLSSIARKLIDPIFKKNLLSAKNTLTIYQLITCIEVI